MKSLPAVVALLLGLPLMSLAIDEPIPRHFDEDGPSLGVVPLELKELWRVGGEDEDVIFGRIVDVKMHDDGNTYVVDNQLCQIVVISREGEHLANLSRQGDGPGELRQPMGLVFLPGEILGVGMGFPAKLVTMELDGTPITTRYPVGEPADGNVGLMMSVRYVDGILVASGGSMVFDHEGKSHVDRFLAVTDAGFDGHERILERETPLDQTGRIFDEVADYYIDFSWTLAPGGRIFAPMERDAYEISEFDATGKLVQVFGRRYEPRRRTQAEKDEFSPVINLGGDVQDREWDISDHDPCVGRILFNPDDGTIWVLTVQGNDDQPDGILETWDVFGSDGEFLKQVPIPLGHEMNDGSIYLVGNDRLVVVKGTGSAFNSDEDSGETEVEPLEVICYEMR